MPDNRFFKNNGPFTVKEISEHIGATFSGDGSFCIYDISTIFDANKDELTFLDNPKYSKYLSETNASACIISPSYQDSVPEQVIAIITDNPYYSYALVADLFYGNNSSINESFIHTNASIGNNTLIGKNCKINENVVIGDNVNIGDDTVIESGSIIKNGVQIGNSCKISSLVTISHSIIGDNVIIHDGVRIGQDGFGFATHNGIHKRIQQLGRVIIQDNVNIGANTTIDRGAASDTIIGDGTQIDNLVQIGHNVVIGKGCVIVSQVGIAGSTKIGDYVVLGGQVGIAGHLNIGDFVKIAAQSGITRNIDSGKEVGGTPSVPIMQYHRQAVALKKLVTNRKK